MVIRAARLIQARELRGLSRRTAALRSGLTLTRYASLEAMSQEVDEQTAGNLADTFEVPKKFFERSPVPIPEGSLAFYKEPTP